jgi:ABC-type cobalamin/Fe3+-siderophores transport system ATPase subunit
MKEAVDNMYDEPVSTTTTSKTELNVLPEGDSQRSTRNTHFDTLLRSSRSSLAPLSVDSLRLDASNDPSSANEMIVILEEGEVKATSMNEKEKKFHNLRKRLSVYQERVPERLVEVRMKDYSYYIPIKADAPTVKTVGNQSICYAAYEVIRRMHQYLVYRSTSRHPSALNDKNRRRSSRWSPVSASDIFLPFDKKPVLCEINLVLKPGRTYVVLGPPESGKTSLLKAIAGRLPASTSYIGGKPLKNKPHHEGRIEYNGISIMDDPKLVLPNVVSFVGQLDIHAPYLTVKETFDFAFQSRTGGKHKNIGIESEHLAADFDQQRFTENLTIEGLDLSGCADTFVGNSDIRGISGGQRRRVTVGGTVMLFMISHLYLCLIKANCVPSTFGRIRNDARPKSCGMRR